MKNDNIQFLTNWMLLKKYTCTGLIMHALIIFVLTLFIIINIPVTQAKDYSIDSSKSSSARASLNKAKSKNRIKKPRTYKGQSIYNKKGDYVGEMSKNKKCVFVGNSSNGEVKKYSKDINIKKMEFKCK
ncbi:hypothetical protein [Candidatus Venteria ishoeyi]|uniref:Uncharacterized protein n=1 Tax=Candidatus Venteria ishoeyi TaxID=1899563 RepID=A0A1H6F5R1_9GAMM|nr:hypothetical protein [Candidatus Venteria ishoeyi]SEH05442.1 Uncharacterised protein [Candidatus Venteria ishoeyi]